MTESGLPSTDEVGGLLAERERIQGWLRRLDAAGGAAPEAVRQRVRADYDQRLAEVVTRLGAHVATLSASLAAAAATLAERETDRAALEEAMAEAELRHAVGEYLDAQWEELAASHGQRLEVLGEAIGALTGQVDRYSGLLAQITPADTAPTVVVVAEAVLSDEPPSTTAAVERALEVEVGEDGIPVFERPEPGVRRLPEPVILHAPLEAPKFTPKASSPEEPQRQGPGGPIQFPLRPGVRSRRPSDPPGDELAFLRSVTAGTGASAGPSLEPPAGGLSAERTLRCPDCGALNPPNEWYCDQCGGELSVL